MFQFKTVHSDFVNDKRGTIAILFGMTLLIVCVAMGLSVDGGRAFMAKSKAADALDAAALAGARALMVGNPTDAQITAEAINYFERNFALDAHAGATNDNIRVVIDRVGYTITIFADTHVPTTFGRMAGVNKINFTTKAQASFGVGDLELGLVLDTTGSMNDASNSGTGTPKIDELKVAAGQLFDDLLPDAGHSGNIRIGIAPFSASVNAGGYAAAVTNGTSTDHCVVERAGADAWTDADPIIAGDYLKPGKSSLNDIDPTEGLSHAPSAYACEAAPVLPLTSNKATLKAEVNGFQANYWTAGHIGTAWGWYLVSPNWNHVWPVASHPAAYGTKDLTKAIIVMTDGIYNTSYYNGATSAQQAVDICTNAKAKGVLVYTIGFTSPAGAEATLKACASPDPRTGLPGFYHAESEAELTAAFQDIAVKLTALRLAK